MKKGHFKYLMFPSLHSHGVPKYHQQMVSTFMLSDNTSNKTTKVPNKYNP